MVACGDQKNVLQLLCLLHCLAMQQAQQLQKEIGQWRSRCLWLASPGSVYIALGVTTAVIGFERKEHPEA
jgi:hypothetical protein